MLTSLLRFLLFQAAWFGTAILAGVGATGWAVLPMGLFTIGTWARAPQGRRFAMLIAVAVATGIAVEAAA